MPIEIIVTQIFLGVMLFFIVNWIGKHSFSFGYVEITLFVQNEEAPALNFLIRVLTPAVYLLITAALLYAFNLDKYVNRFYFVSLYYILFRLAFNILTRRGPLLNWSKQVVYWLAILCLSYLLYENIIREKNNLLPQFDTIANELWIIILVFVFQLMNGLQLSKNGAEKRTKLYIRTRYLKFKTLYGTIISENTKNKSLEILSYAILIYEDFNRPKIIRLFEYASFQWSKKLHSLGVMQFPTTTLINDYQSVDLGTKKIRSRYESILEKLARQQLDYTWDSEVLDDIISHYNGGSKYLKEVTTLYNILKAVLYSNEDERLLPSRETNENGSK